MRYVVNDSCIGCGLCEAICPEVFELLDGHAAARNVDALMQEAEDAMDGCPVQAIEHR